MAEVNAAAIKLPTFWTTSPSAWFAQAEAQFAIRGLTQDDTKYYYVVAALDSATATCALPIITAPPTTDKFKAIKNFLTSAFELSDCERAAALFNLTGLGDSKPSELMDSMLSLLGNHSPCFLFKHLFLQQIPDYVRAPLASSAVTDYRALAQEADKIYLAGRAQPQHLQEVNSTNRQTTRFSVQSPRLIDNMCYYHHRFGSKARKCIKNCKHYDEFNQTQGNGQRGQR